MPDGYQKMVALPAESENSESAPLQTISTAAAAASTDVDTPEMESVRQISAKKSKTKRVNNIVDKITRISP